MPTEFNIIKYSGFNNKIFFALCEKDEQYYILYGLTDKLELELERTTNFLTALEPKDIKLLSFYDATEANINISFLVKNQKLFSIYPIKDKQEYQLIIDIMENIYG